MNLLPWVRSKCILWEEHNKKNTRHEPSHKQTTTKQATGKATTADTQTNSTTKEEERQKSEKDIGQSIPI